MPSEIMLMPRPASREAISKAGAIRNELDQLRKEPTISLSELEKRIGL